MGYPKHARPILHEALWSGFRKIGAQPNIVVRLLTNPPCCSLSPHGLESPWHQPGSRILHRLGSLSSPLNLRKPDRFIRWHFESRVTPRLLKGSLKPSEKALSRRLNCKYFLPMAAYCFGAFFEIKTLLGLEVSNLLSRRKITLCPQSRPQALALRMSDLG